jgi:hypothetical protein
MAEQKRPPAKKIPAKKASSKPVKPASSSKKSSANSPRKKTAVPKSKAEPILQKAFWHKKIDQMRAWLDDWWEHGIQQPPSLPEKNKREKTTIRLQTRHIQQTPRPKRARSSASGIHLVGKEEHRCPYCLEEVASNDPRGVKICPICHTHHHADCWAVTGACQVPHYHE